MNRHGSFNLKIRWYCISHTGKNTNESVLKSKYSSYIYTVRLAQLQFSNDNKRDEVLNLNLSDLLKSFVNVNSIYIHHRHLTTYLHGACNGSTVYGQPPSTIRNHGVTTMFKKCHHYIKQTPTAGHVNCSLPCNSSCGMNKHCF